LGLPLDEPVRLPASTIETVEASLL